LRTLVQSQQAKINNLQTDCSELKLQQAEMKRELQILKVSTRSLSVFVGAAQQLAGNLLK
jgi:hypothetical protein